MVVGGSGRRTRTAGTVGGRLRRQAGSRHSGIAGPADPNPTDVGGEVQASFEADLGHGLIQELALRLTPMYLPVRLSSPPLTSLAAKAPTRPIASSHRPA